VQQPIPQQQPIVLHGDPFIDLKHLAQLMKAKGYTNKHVSDTLEDLEWRGMCRKFCDTSGTDKSKRPWLLRVYVVRGFPHLTHESLEVTTAVYARELNKAKFIAQQEAGGGCLRLRVVGLNPEKARSRGLPVSSEADADTASAALRDELNLRSLVLLSWRLQHEPKLQLDWFEALIREARPAADPAAAAAAAAASGGT
jgi:hypothetical protein